MAFTKFNKNPLKIILTITIVASTNAIAGQLDREKPEDCGSPPGKPNWIEKQFNTEKQQDFTRWEQCYARNKEIQKRNIDKQTTELERIVKNAHESCRRAIRSIASNAGTLSFDPYPDFDYLHGLNGSGVDITDGGYSATVSGSHISGKFSIKCYMDKNFRVKSTT